MAKKQANLEDIIQNKNDNVINQPSDPNQAKINTLVNEIRGHRYLYYNKTPKIADSEYDTLEEKLKQLAPDHPILREIGQDSSDLFTKKEHIIMMGSQDKVVTPEEFTKWAKKVKHQRFLAQL